jgi:hypothetical protein
MMDVVTETSRIRLAIASLPLCVFCLVRCRLCGCSNGNLSREVLPTDTKLRAVLVFSFASY